MPVPDTSALAEKGPTASARGTPGLREQKKVRTRQALAAAAAGLFARYGYPNVTMTQIAAAAGVADQTLYNYFPTKESLVFDQSAELESTLIGAMTARAAGVSIVDAYAAWLDGTLLGEAARRSLHSPGGMPKLVATSESLHRMLLGQTHQIATSLAGRLRESDGLAEPAAVAIADALLAVFARTIEQLGVATSEAELPAIRDRASAAIDTLRPLGG
jgi:AcrR family transcriptional regulator